MKTLNLTFGFISFTMGILLLIYSFAAMPNGITAEAGPFGAAAIIVLTIYSAVAGAIAIITKDEDGKYIYVPACFFIFGGMLGAVLSWEHSNIFMWCLAYIACGISFAIVSFIMGEDL